MYAVHSEVPGRRRPSSAEVSVPQCSFVYSLSFLSVCTPTCASEVISQITPPRSSDLGTWGGLRRADTEV